MDRKKCFLQDLTRRGPEAYEAFVEILFGTNQIEAGRVLRPDFFERDFTQEEVIDHIVHGSPTDAGGGIELAGSGNHSRSGNTIASIQNEELLLKVKKCKEAMIGKNYYRMSSSPRGFCLIINNFKFSDEDNYPERKGSQTEATRLRDVFEELHFIVVSKTNLKRDEILSTLEEYSKKVDLRKHDALILIVLSHGISQYLLGIDGVCVHFEEIVKKFNNQNCPLLINKPKLFFFNCCRGG
jgi:hypothetical protein